MAAERPPLDHLTAENTGPAVITVIYILASLSTVAAIIPFWFSIHHKIAFGLDDATYALANLWAIASTILWHLAVTAGLGKRIAFVSLANVDRFFKFEYAAQLVEIIAMLCAKAAFALLIERVTPRQQWAKITISSSIGAWALFSLFTLAFQCPLPRPWVFEPAQCSDNGRLLYPIIIFNVLTDIVLGFWITPIIWQLHIDRKDRLFIIMMLASRVCILIPAIIEIHMMHLFLNNFDQTRVTTIRVILNQIIVYVSVVGAAVPRMSNFLSHLPTDRNVAVVPEFEIYNARQIMTEPIPHPSPTACLDVSNDTSEDFTLSSTSFIIQKKIVPREDNIGMD